MMGGNARWMGIVWRRVPDSRHPQHGNGDLSCKLVEAVVSQDCLACPRQKQGERGGKEKGGWPVNATYRGGDS